MQPGQKHWTLKRKRYRPMVTWKRLFRTSQLKRTSKQNSAN
ncbi:unnamed protein product [Cyprideis torosa]|uniref:Uncharacterized protein n=1 Tax=Cyprideis torosa TaxID=163714 RepID=A0A7R8WSH5_9CRUS|nr:unnamed protein product [Cyprideis torosa]CAG0904810.1 unnamed protein product [Cyprideis torosa]